VYDVLIALLSSNCAVIDVPRDVALSVVVTNHNYGRFVAQAVDSVLDQRRGDVEVVVVDDGSTDDSFRVLMPYASRVRLVAQGHGGMAAAFTAGVEASRAAWVMFLDADDVLLPGACERILAATSDDVVRVQWQTREVDVDLRPTGTLVPAEAPTGGDVRALVERDGPFAVVNAHGCGTAWSRKFLAQAFPIPTPQFDRHCDAYLATLASLAGPSAVINDPISLYRLHGNNDYAGQCRTERYRRTLEVYRLRCQLLAERTGLDPRRWLDGNPHYDWLTQLNDACADIQGVIPPHATYVLIDEDHWAAGGQLLTDRVNLPFPAFDGRYAGPPADNAAAVAALDRCVAAGATHLVVARHAAWWLDSYPSLQEKLGAAEVGRTQSLRAYTLT
jgi:glycosyltransferase involved in cell wall biosynthesis